MVRKDNKSLWKHTLNFQEEALMRISARSEESVQNSIHSYFEIGAPYRYLEGVTLLNFHGRWGRPQETGDLSGVLLF
jgi:hypothetical protein